MIAIEEKLDALMNKMGNHERRMHSTNEVGTVDENEKRNSAEEGLSHKGPYQVKEAHYLKGTYVNWCLMPRDRDILRFNMAN